MRHQLAADLRLVKIRELIELLFTEHRHVKIDELVAYRRPRQFFIKNRPGLLLIFAQDGLVLHRPAHLGKLRGNQAADLVVHRPRHALGVSQFEKPLGAGAMRCFIG